MTWRCWSYLEPWELDQRCSTPPGPTCQVNLLRLLRSAPSDAKNSVETSSGSIPGPFRGGARKQNAPASPLGQESLAVGTPRYLLRETFEPEKFGQKSLLSGSVVEVGPTCEPGST